MINCPRCGKILLALGLTSRCLDCSIVYYHQIDILDWMIIINKDVYRLSWYLNQKECIFKCINNPNLKISRLNYLPFNVSIEKLESLLILL